MGEGCGGPGPVSAHTSSCPRAWDTCAMRTKSQATHPPEPRWAQSYPALPLANPGQRTWHLHRVQTGLLSLQGAWRLLARCPEGSPAACCAINDAL